MDKAGRQSHGTARPGQRQKGLSALFAQPGAMRWAVLGAWVALAVLLGLVHIQDYRSLAAHGEFFTPQGHPLLHEFDAYYHLRLARDLREGIYVAEDPLRDMERPASAPPLPLLAAGAAAASGLDLEWVAFILPPVLAATLLLALWLCGRLLGAPWLGLLAAAAAFTTQYLYSRTCLGFFDTDGLNPMFLLLTPLCVFQFTLLSGPRRWGWLALWAAGQALFIWWWPQGGGVAAGLTALAYALSFPAPSSRGERALKLALLALLAGVGVLLVLQYLEVVYTEIGAFETIITHVRLILQGGEQAVAVGGSVQELAPQLPSSVFLDLAAFPGAVLLAEVGLVALAVVCRRFALFLLPLLVFASASVFSQRFMIFTAPLYGLGYGYFYVLLAERVRWVRDRAWAKAALLVVLAALLAPSYARNLAWRSTPPLASRDLPLAEAVRERAPAGAAVWSWWDYGYFLQYMAGRRTVCDGGMASDALVRTLSMPLATSSPERAARWMRFVAARPRGFFYLRGRVGGLGPAAVFLDQVFAAPERAGELAVAAGLPRDRDWPAFLLPADQEVVLYLNRHTIDLAYWWYTFGTDTLRGPGRVPAELVDRRPLAEFEVDYAAGLFTRRLDRAGLRVAEVVDVRRAGVARYPADSAAKAAAVVYRDEGLVYFVARELLDTLAFRLLYAPLGETAPGFTPLYRDPVAGGVWRADLR